jgi:hypothetical protein
MGQRRTHALPQTASSFDHLVGDGESARWNGKAERLRGLEVDHQSELGWLQHWQVRRLGSLKNLAHVDTSVALSVRLAGSVTDQATFHRELTKLVNRGHSMPCRQHNELFDATAELPLCKSGHPAF